MNRLHYAGIMSCYVCSAACRHCMYACAPSMPKAFMTSDMAEYICATLAHANVRSVHIGGGEPFLNFESLVLTIEAMNRHGIALNYIETNASWCINEQHVRERLRTLKQLGATCVMASVDPFHIEFVPLERPLMLVGELRAAGFEYFIWQERYLRKLLPLDHSRPIPHDELKAALGAHYIEQAMREYGLTLNGRALKYADRLVTRRPLGAHLSSSPCHLLDGSHCHADLFGNIVPSGCPGIAIELTDFLRGTVPEHKYPVASRLMNGGLSSLYAYAQQHGFQPDDTGYVSPCALCHAIRAHLLTTRPSADIGPACYYRAMA